jgi:hypothetical protein
MVEDGEMVGSEVGLSPVPLDDRQESEALLTAPF